MSREEFTQRYSALAHAIQSGVAHDHNLGSQDGTPKHLRTGVNLAMRDHASLVALLMHKGVISEDEYQRAILEGLEEEKASYESRLSQKLNGTKITLA